MNGQQFTDDVRAARERVDRLHERVATIHVCDQHASEQLLERLMWAIEDAERAEHEIPVAH